MRTELLELLGEKCRCSTAISSPGPAAAARTSVDSASANLPTPSGVITGWKLPGPARFASRSDGVPASRRQHWAPQIRGFCSFSTVTITSDKLGRGSANLDSSFADVGDYRDRRPAPSDIWKRRYCRLKRQLGRPGSLGCPAHLCGMSRLFRHPSSACRQIGAAWRRCQRAAA